MKPIYNHTGPDEIVSINTYTLNDDCELVNEATGELMKDEKKEVKERPVKMQTTAQPGKVYSLFNKSGKIEEMKPSILPMYCKIQFIGYGDAPGAVIAQGRREGSYKIVTMSKYDTPRISEHDYIRPLSEKFGIGTYYVDSMETYTEAEVLPWIQKAEDAVKAEEERAEAARIQTAKNIEIGKKLFLENKPSDAVGVIVATFEADDSDPYTDYFNSKTERTIIIGWTNKKRDDFNEMRKAAKLCPIPEVNIYGTKPEKPADAPDYWTAPDENREKYSMGKGFYLGPRLRSGVFISKRVYDNLNNCSGLWDIAGQEGGFYAFKTNEAEATEPEAKQYAPVKVEAGEVNIVDYSEKSFAVIGDTKPIKELLSSLGGKFNFRLSCGPGWIFQKKHLQKVTEALGGTETDPEPEPEPETTKKSTEDRTEAINNFTPVLLLNASNEAAEATEIEIFEDAEEVSTLQSEINKTVEFFKETDVKIYGQVTEQTKEIEEIQKPKDLEPDFKKINLDQNFEHDFLKKICEAYNNTKNDFYRGRFCWNFATDLAGDSKKELRQIIVSAIRGKQTPKSECGVHSLELELETYIQRMLNDEAQEVKAIEPEATEIKSIAPANNNNLQYSLF